MCAIDDPTLLDLLCFEGSKEAEVVFTQPAGNDLGNVVIWNPLAIAPIKSSSNTIFELLIDN
jgi:hypothetical protein